MLVSLGFCRMFVSFNWFPIIHFCTNFRSWIYTIPPQCLHQLRFMVSVSFVNVYQFINIYKKYLYTSAELYENELYYELSRKRGSPHPPLIFHPRSLLNPHYLVIYKPPIICFVTDKEFSVFLSWREKSITKHQKSFLFIFCF